MKKIFVLVWLVLVCVSCENENKQDELKKVNWKNRVAKVSPTDSLETGESYLSIYSQIYSLSQHKRYNLTAMVSLRNTSKKDTIYLLKADYYDTHGELIKTYFDQPVYVSPMETLEIVIDEGDISGGTGSNFLFDWQIPQNCPEPLFEAVMSSTVGSQGLSFTTQAKRIQ
ncbi:MAG: hypothetical protein CMC76_02500 [Flavobacteriaceae bacterium]|uniref:DUF3124 domain-containing protein n=1 Tax=Winogradskyella sp. SYSU M77433 TaxID=3042722 RepID=UPI000C4F5590|nr:DUF3124 domain-containing protein [Winogradskyella sp. SYSU M77433]MAX69957.1 hypothetical protein [Flavobacteriaceae bacterium]MDH7913036.1 DUF3124 domain-containing protein [Winogradskyella sp. SYSU M77433]